jgi:hypothetical protein
MSALGSAARRNVAIMNDCERPNTPSNTDAYSGNENCRETQQSQIHSATPTICRSDAKPSGGEDSRR